MIVANDVTKKGAGFGTDTNRVTFLRKDGSVERLPLMTKAAVATIAAAAPLATPPELHEPIANGVASGN